MKSNYTIAQLKRRTADQFPHTVGPLTRSIEEAPLDFRLRVLRQFGDASEHTVVPCEEDVLTEGMIPVHVLRELPVSMWPVRVANMECVGGETRVQFRERVLREFLSASSTLGLHCLYDPRETGPALVGVPVGIFSVDTSYAGPEPALKTAPVDNELTRRIAGEYRAAVAQFESMGIAGTRAVEMAKLSTIISSMEPLLHGAIERLAAWWDSPDRASSRINPYEATLEFEPARDVHSDYARFAQMEDHELPLEYEERVSTGVVNHQKMSSDTWASWRARLMSIASQNGAIHQTEAPLVRWNTKAGTFQCMNQRASRYTLYRDGERLGIIEASPAKQGMRAVDMIAAMLRADLEE